VNEPSRAVFLSYATEDTAAARRICDTLRVAGIEVWFDQNELRGGDAWDHTIRQQIRECALFIPIISQRTQERLEGYFRREWRLAEDRTLDMAAVRSFLVPVAIDDTAQRTSHVPPAFNAAQWTRLPEGNTPQAFVDRIKQLLSPVPAALTAAHAAVSAQGIQGIPRPKRNLVITVAGLCLAALTAVLIVRLWSPSGTSATPLKEVARPIGPYPASSAPLHSVAVLPFVDMSEKKDQEYFADGMAEEVLDTLAKVPQLTVIGRTSSFQFKNRSENLPTIGRKLNSAYLVEGTVRKAGERIRVTAQLIDSRFGAQIWSDTYDRDFGDVFTLQDEIATSIVRALQLTIRSHDTRQLRSAEAIEAYTLYLKGKLALDKFEAKSLLDAQSLFQQALVLDPTLAAAAEGLALTYLNRGADEIDITAREAWELARGAAETALRLDPDSAVAHGVVGFVAWAVDYDFPRAESEFHKAIALNPNDPDTLANYAQILVMHGDYDEALQRVNNAIALDPLNALTYYVLGQVLYIKGDYPSSEVALRKAIGIDPGIEGAHYYIGLINLHAGRVADAAKETALDADISTHYAGNALTAHALGKHAESDAALAMLIAEYGKTWPYGVALVYGYRGEKDKAFEWLNRARDVRDIDLMFAPREPFMTSLHEDPRWSELLKKMNLAK
jgi:TolB-like protein/Flp pilus assembly protein TadD